MHRIQGKGFFFSLAVFGMLLLLAAVHAVQAAPSAVDGEPPYRMFIALVSKPGVYLNGKVTFKGVPAANQKVELRFYDGTSYSTVDSALTDANGDYRMVAPHLEYYNQSMYVRWINTADNDAWLVGWYCDEITVDPQQDASCSFDIQDVVLTDSNYEVSLPYVFKWTKRVTASDSYEHNLADPSDLDPWLQSNPQGYVDSYKLYNLPDAFITATYYGWWMTVHGPGGSGDSYYYIPISFNNRGQYVSGPLSGPRLRNELRADPIRP